MGWTQLIDSIPLDWRTKIRDNAIPDQDCMSKYGLYYNSDSGLHLVDLSCKAMYSKLLSRPLHCLSLHHRLYLLG